MEMFVTNKSILLKGTPKELQEYLDKAALKFTTIEELIKANLN